VRAAIKDKGFKDVKAFAAANSLAYESLISVLSGRRGLSKERFRIYAKMLDVPMNWLRDGPSHSVVLDTSLIVSRMVSWNFTPTEAMDGGNTLRRVSTPHYSRRVEAPFSVPLVQPKRLFAAYCDGTTDVALIEGTMLLCSEWHPKKAEMVAAVEGAAEEHAAPLLRELLPHDKKPPTIGYLLREAKHDTERVLPFFRQYDDVHACPATPGKPVRLPVEVPPQHEIIGMIHAFWRGVFLNGG
jgi:hypothetical protein